VVRVTADCPLIDPAESDRVVRELRERAGEADYASNVRRRTYPRGLDTEAFYRDVLDRMDRRGRSTPSREHVTWYLHREQPSLFSIHSVEDAQDNSDLRWTVDTPADLAMVRRLYADLDLGSSVRPYREILAHVRAHPAIAAMNAEIAQKDA
jgi:spore coat polysaccharide biosynthesis protein SpsF